jgi:cytochrome c oxidase assembly protein subunit 15
MVGLLVVGLTRWLGGSPSRKPLAIIGGLELFAGLLMVQFSPGLKGTGHFLAGIGGVVLLAALVWKRHAPAPAPLPALGWVVFFLVQFQGLLGGLRVVWFKNEIGIFHGTLAQIFFVLVCVIALFTSRWWAGYVPPVRLPARSVASAVLLVSGLILVQLMIGATMRHQHAGLAIPDFPLAYGKLWPDLDPASVERYNQSRMEIFAHNPITAFQVALQMVHRLMALAILLGVAHCAWTACRRLGAGNPVAKLALLWLGLIGAQVILGALTIWTNKAADIATAHVLFGALSLATGAILSIVTLRQCAAQGVAETGPGRARPANPAPQLRQPAPGQAS